MSDTSIFSERFPTMINKSTALLVVVYHFAIDTGFISALPIIFIISTTLTYVLSKQAERDRERQRIQTKTWTGKRSARFSHQRWNHCKMVREKSIVSCHHIPTTHH